MRILKSVSWLAISLGLLIGIILIYLGLSFKNNVIHPDICESFIFSSTQQSDKYFIYSKDMSDHPMTYKFYTLKEHLQQASCSHWEQHFQTIQNYGDSFQGAFFTGNNSALILHMNDIPLDLSSVDANERYEFYDKFLPSITYYISQTGISILSQRSDIISNKGNDNVVFCENLGRLASIWSDFKNVSQKENSFELHMVLIYNMVAFCDENWKLSLKSQSQKTSDKIRASSYYADVVADYYGQDQNTIDKDLRQAIYQDKLSELSLENNDCPFQFEIISHFGMCFEYLPKIQ